MNLGRLPLKDITAVTVAGHRVLATLAMAAVLTAAAALSAGAPSSSRIASTDDSAADLAALIASPPLGLPAVPVPEDNPVSRAKIDLGRKLFFDRRLSFNGTLSCGMCHIPEQGFTQHELRTPVGSQGRFVKRNAPSLYNVAYRPTLFHDGRELSLELQVWQPLLLDNEMANPAIGLVLQRLTASADYPPLFREAFGADPDMASLGMALASYQRGLLSANSRFDRWFFGGDRDALAAVELRGFELFRASGCTGCHLIGSEYALFTDNGFHDTGIGYARAMGVGTAPPVQLAPGLVLSPGVVFPAPPLSDLGRYEATGLTADRWLYRTPSLRNVAITAPYMHDGSLPDIASVLAYYNRGAVPHAGLDPRIKPLGLDAQELAELEAFLRALTGSNVDELRADGRSTGVGDHQN